MLDAIVFKMLFLIYNISVHFHLFSHSRMFQNSNQPIFRNKLSTYSSISMWTVGENSTCLHFHTKTQEWVKKSKSLKFKSNHYILSIIIINSSIGISISYKLLLLY